MTSSQLITKVANDTGISAGEVEKIMDGIFGTIGDVLKAGDKMCIRDRDKRVKEQRAIPHNSRLAA